MSDEQHIDNLERLVDLRAREVDRLGADMSARQATRNRFAGSLARLENLFQGSGASGAPAPAPGGSARPSAVMSPSLSLNCGSYKQAVMKMAAAHRLDLTLYEADMAVAKRVLLSAARRHEALDQALARQRQGALEVHNRREQKRQDDMALQIWRRSRK